MRPKLLILILTMITMASSSTGLKVTVLLNKRIEIVPVQKIPGTHLYTGVYYKVTMPRFPQGFVTWTADTNDYGANFVQIDIKPGHLSKYEKGQEWDQDAQWMFRPTEDGSWYILDNRVLSTKHGGITNWSFKKVGSGYHIIVSKKAEDIQRLGARGDWREHALWKPVLAKPGLGRKGSYKLINKSYPEGTITWTEAKYRNVSHFIQVDINPEQIANYKTGGKWFTDSLFTFTPADVVPLVDAAIQEAKKILEQDRLLTCRQTKMCEKHKNAFTNHTYVKFSELTEALGESSNENLIALDILLKNGVERDPSIKELVSRRHPFCKESVLRCNPTGKYRMLNGTCNNLKHPRWGSAFTPFNRIVPNKYSDSYNSPVIGSPTTLKLPNPRVLSRAIHGDLVQAHARITNMLPQFGQFLDHDMTLTPEGDKRCCSGVKHVDCFSIPIPANDTFYSKLLTPQSCMDFTRSTPFCFPTPSGVREQMNILTAYIDASNVYGSEDERMNLVRSFVKGKLRTSRNPNYPPTVAELEKLKNKSVHFMGTFVAGDERVNEMPALLTMHTLFLRHHNRIADMILAERPDASDEFIFQEARRIVIAEMQNIAYGQYLPVLLGSAAMNKYGLRLDDQFSPYDASVDASIFHSFATAAYRFGHTFLNGLVQIMQGHTHLGSYRIRDNFFLANQMTQDGGRGYDYILGGLIRQNAQNYDPFVTEDFTNFVLRLPTEEFGGDLVARNIQRGRDHGLQPYMAYRRYCGLRTSSNWTSKPSDVRADTWALLKKFYGSPEDIELFSGGLAEVPANGALTGATFVCLKALQFQRLKKGDRFFFTHSSQAGSFNLGQMQHIRRRTLGDIICENSNQEMTPRDVFLITGSSNPTILCNSTARVRLDIKLLLNIPTSPEKSNLYNTPLSLQATTECCKNTYVGIKKDAAWIIDYMDIIFSQLENNATFRLVPGLAKSELYSIESLTYPGHYLRHANWRIYLHRKNGSQLMKEDATFYVRPGPNQGEVRFESYNYPGSFIRHYNWELYIANQKPEFRHLSQNAAWVFLEDTIWKITTPVKSWFG